VFEIRLPQVRISAIDSLPAEIQPFAMDLSDLQAVVLIVDDVASNRQLLAASFEGTGITVLTAENGAEALERTRAQHPDLILMDLKMPVMDGYEAYRRLRADPELRHIPVIATTASILESDPALTDFSGYLRKPISKAALFQEICRVLGYQPQPGQEMAQPSQAKSADIPAEALTMLPEALAQLENTFRPRWEQFHTIQPVNEVRQFGNDLLALGEHCRLEMVCEYGRALVTAIKHFDIHAMRTRLHEFPAMLAKLQSLRNHGEDI
jgi:two-component system sensor histidine kinase EvgS